MSDELTLRVDKTLATSKSPLAQTYRKLRNERPDFLEQVTNYCLLGATDHKLAKIFGVQQTTILYWLKHSEEFREAVLAGGEKADADVASALHKRATGYTVDKPKLIIEKGHARVLELTEHVPPDTTAAKFWLTNRAPNEWRDRQALEHTGADGGPIDTEISIKFVGTTTSMINITPANEDGTPAS